MNGSAFRDGLLEGKVAFVAGGTSGINLGIAKRFASLGAHVAVCGRDPDKAVRAAEAIGHHALGLSADVRDFAAIRGALETASANLLTMNELIDRMGRITASLRSFARRGDDRGQASLSKAVDATLQVLNARIEGCHLKLHSNYSDQQLAFLTGGQQRLEYLSGLKVELFHSFQTIGSGFGVMVITVHLVRSFSLFQQIDSRRHVRM